MDRNASRFVGVVLVGWTVGLGAAGCKRKPQSANASATANAPPHITFDVRQNSTDLTFFWFDSQGAAHAAASISEVPEASRGMVRIDPSRPELRAAGWVYIADLRTAGPDGRYPVRAVPSEQLASELARINGLAAAMAAAEPSPPTANPAGSAPSNAPAAQGQIVIYGASWCGACHQAAEYLRAHNIPFVERDIEREPDAARELTTRAQAQGVPTGSIPIIDVNGRLLVGFDPAAIERALRGG